MPDTIKNHEVRLQHIVQRGNNREPCFYSKEDYSRYLEDIKNTLVRNSCVL